MKVEEMKIGRAVDILILREGFKYRLGSKIEEVKKDIVYVSLITSKGRVFHFEETDEIVVIYKTDTRLFKWNKVRGGIDQLDGDRVHILKLPGEGKPYNRRDSFRVPVDESAVFSRYVMKEKVTQAEIDVAKMKLEAHKAAYVTAEGKEPTEPITLLPEEDPRYEKKQFTGLIKDISESGVGMYTNEKLEIGSEVTFELFTSFGKMKFYADVMRVVDERRNAFNLYYGCSFTKSDKDLPRYLVEIQRIQLKKMKGKR